MISQHPLAAAYREKVAAFMGPQDIAPLKQIGRNLLETAAYVVPTVAATAGLASAVYDKMTAASRKANAFKAMVDQNPHLGNYDQALVQKYFNTLHHINPHLAADPTTAASFVGNLARTSDPAQGVNYAHREVFDTALRAGGGGGGGRQMGSPVMDAANQILGVQKQLTSLDTSEKDQQAKVKERMMGMHKRRAEGAYRKMENMQRGMQQVSEDAARMQDILENTYGHRF